jgi:hypothetical protein
MPSLYLKAAIAVALVLIGFGVGWTVQGWRHDSADLVEMESEQRGINQAVERERKIVELRDARLQVVAQLDAERERKARVEERIVNREIVKYVSSAGSARCALDAGGVRILNLAAGYGLPTDPGAAGSPDAGAR